MIVLAAIIYTEAIALVSFMVADIIASHRFTNN